MIHKIYTVYDSKIEAYLPPFFMQSHAAAIRALSDTMRDDKHPFSMHPEDYTFYYLGEFDDNNCHYELEKTPVSLGVLIELVPQLPLPLTELREVQ